MARRVSGWGYDYGSGGGGGDFSYYGRGGGGGSDAGSDFMEGFAALGKALIARKSEQDREKRQAEVYQRQNTKHIPEEELTRYRQEWESTLPDQKLRRSPEGVFGFTDYAVKQWDKKRLEAAAAKKAEEEAQQRFEQETKEKEKLEGGFRTDQEKARDAAVKEARRLELETRKFEQTRRAAEVTNARNRMSAARQGLDPSAAVQAPLPEPPLGVQMKRVPVYDVVDEFADPRYGTANAARYADIPITDERTFLTTMEERQLRQGRPQEIVQPPAVQEPVQRTMQPTTQPRTAAQLREASAAPAPRQAAQPARQPRPDAPPFPQPRTPEQVYENKLWTDSVKASRAAVKEAESAWSGAGGGVNAAALESHAQGVLDEYLGWRASSGLEDLDDREQRAVKETIKSQIRGYGGGANKGRQVIPGVTRAGEPEWKSSQPFGLDDETRNAIAAEAWSHPSREYPGLYRPPSRPAAQAPRPQPPVAKPAEESWYDRGLSTVAGALGMRVSPEDLRPAQDIAAQSRVGAVQPAAPTPQRAGALLPGMSQMPGVVRADDTMTPEELTQYRALQKETEGLKSLATAVAMNQLRAGKTQEEAVAAATQAVERQSANLDQQRATGQHLLAAPVSERIALQIDEALTARNAAKMAVQAAVMAAATYLTGGGALAAGIGAGAGNIAGQALLNKPGEAVDPRQALLEGATVGIASKIPLGAVERGLSRVAAPLGRVAPAAARGVVGGAREAVQEMSEAGVQAGLEGRAPTAEELAVSGIVGGIYGPAFEAALNAGRGAENPSARTNPTVPPTERAAAIAQSIVERVRAEQEAPAEAAAAAPPEPGSPAAPVPVAPRPAAGGTAMETGFAANRAEADDAIRAALDPDEVAFLEAQGLLTPRQPAPAPAGPQTAADLAGQAALATAAAPPGAPARPRRGRAGRTQPPGTTPAPTGAAPAAPEAIPGLAPALQQPDFATWVDQMLGPGSFSGLTAQFRATGDGADLADLRRAYAQGQTAAGDPIAARGLADIQRSPLSKAALAEQARQYEQRRLAESRVGQVAQPGASPYTVTRGPDGQFYVMTTAEPDVTKAELEGRAGVPTPGRRAIAGPFTDAAAAQSAAQLMQSRFEGAVQPRITEGTTPSETLRLEREQARQLYRGAPSAARGARRNVGTGKPSPAVLEPGTDARLRAEAAAAAAQAKVPKAKGRKKGKAAPPAAAPATPAARPRTVADLKAAQARVQAKRAADEAAAAARAREQAGVEAVEPDEGELLSMLRDVVGTANNAGDLASMLGITTEEATVLMKGKDAADRLSGTTMMADPFGVGIVQQILDRRAVKAAADVLNEVRARRKELKTAKDTAKGGTLQEGTAEGFGDRIFRDVHTVIDQAEQFPGMPGTRGGVTTVERRPGNIRVLVETEGDPDVDVPPEEDPTVQDAFDEFLAENPEDPLVQSIFQHPPGRSRMNAHRAAFTQWINENIPDAGQRGEFLGAMISTPNFTAEITPDGVVSSIGSPREVRGGFAAGADLLRALSVAAELGGRFEIQDQISDYTAKLYKSVEAMTGVPAEQLPGMAISDVISAPYAQALLQRLARRDAAQKPPKAEGATADFMGLQQSWENLKGIGSAAARALGAGAGAAQAAGAGGIGRKVGRLLTTGPRSALEATRDLGPAGERIADSVERYRDFREGLRGRWHAVVDNALAKVPENERGAIADLLEGKQRPASPATVQAAQEIRTALDEVSQLAQQNERTTGYLADYFPRILATRPDLAQRAKKAAVDFWNDPTHQTKMQAAGITGPNDPRASGYAAAALMFPTGKGPYGGLNPNLEKHRTGMMAAYRTDPEVLYQYLSGASRSIAQAAAFDSPKLGGPNAQGKTRERFGDWKSAWAEAALGNEESATRLRLALEKELGIEQPIDQTGMGRALQDVTDIVASTSLALSFLQQPLSAADTAATLGLGPATQGLSALAQNRGAAEAAAVRAGSIPSRGAAKGRGFAEEASLSQEPAGAGNILSRTAKFYRELPWMGAMQEVDRANRIIADSAARQSLPRTIESVRKNDAGTLALLKGAGVDPATLLALTPQDIAAAASYGQMSPGAEGVVDQYARRITEFTQQRARAGDLPAFASTAPGRLATMFMPFKYRQAKNMAKAFKANPARFIASGLPAYLFLGAVSAAARSILAGYGYEGEELEGDLTDKIQRVLGNKRIKRDSVEGLVFGVMQDLYRAVPTPMALSLGSRVERAGDAASLQSAVAGPVSRVFEAAGTALEGARGRSRPSTMSRGEYAARGLAAGAGLMFGPSAYSYQLRQELMGQESPYPKKEIAVPPTPGLVGRTLDVMRGETTIPQYIEGVVKGGEGTLSKRRKERKRNIKENRRRSGRDLAKDAREYTTFRAVPTYR
jgi:hypothetical protein